VRALFIRARVLPLQIPLTGLVRAQRTFLKNIQKKNNTKKIHKKPIAITSHKNLMSFFSLSLPQRNHSKVSKIPAYPASHDVAPRKTEKLKGNKTEEFKNQSFLKKMPVWQNRQNLFLYRKETQLFEFKVNFLSFSFLYPAKT
jgi:hypothetical protein